MFNILKEKFMKVYSYVDMTRANSDGSYAVYVIVSNKRGRFFVNTGLTTCDRLIGGRVFPKKDRNSSAKTTILGKYVADVEALCMQHELVSYDNQSLKSIIKKEIFGIQEREKSYYLSDCIKEFSKQKKKSTSILYERTSRKVAEFDARANINNINVEWLERFRQWCIEKGMKINGAGKELRNIRAVYNWCCRSGMTKNYPFAYYSIQEEDTCPNNFSVDDIRRLRDYPCEDWQQRYVDFFMLSFYLAGINPGDLLLLRKEAIKDSHITFVRQKTSKQGARKIRNITLPIVKEAWDIIDKYPSKEGYVLGLMDGRKDYRSFVKECNKALQKVGTSCIVPDKVGKMRKIEYHPLFPKITLYVARYSFASIAANDLDVSEQVIGQCLGHSWSHSHVTSRYISHDQKKIDRTVYRVVEFLKSGDVY